MKSNVKYLIFFLILFSINLFLTSCGSTAFDLSQGDFSTKYGSDDSYDESEEDEEEKDNTALISGTIFASDTGLGLSGATVTVTCSSYWFTSFDCTATTGADGKYTIDVSQPFKDNQSLVWFLVKIKANAATYQEGYYNSYNTFKIYRGNVLTGYDITLIKI